MKIALYLATDRSGVTKGREYAIGSALKAGFERHGDTVHVVHTSEYGGPLDGVQLAAVIGVKGRSKMIFDEHRRAGRHALLIDKSYFGRSEFLRLSLDGFQPYYAHTKERPHDRLERLGLEFGVNRRAKKDFIVFAGSSQKYCDWHGLGDATEFATGICTRLNKIFGTGTSTPSSIPVHYRPKPSWAAGHPEDVKQVPGTVFSGPDVKFRDLLQNCHAVVTHGSNAAVEAIVAGVPAIVVSRGACAAEPVAELDDQRAGRPFFPSEERRRQWAANLAYCQFTLEEIASGAAWRTLHEHTIKEREEEIRNMNALDAAIEQYRIMHQSPKMFRGRLAEVYAAEIAEATNRLGLETLLDYGSGKGHQYSVSRQHEVWGFPQPRCFDPGVPEFAGKPTEQFDGVISLDCMEHIPEQYVDQVLGEIFGFARKYVFLVIFTDLARKSLPDGRNCHLTVRPEAWWRERIAAANRAGIEMQVHFKGREE